MKFLVCKTDEKFRQEYDFVIESESTSIYKITNQLAKMHNCMP